MLLAPTQTQNQVQDCCEVSDKFHLSQAELPTLVCAGRAGQGDVSEHAGSGAANCSGRLPFWQEKQTQWSMERKWQLDQEMEGRREETEGEYETGL